MPRPPRGTLPIQTPERIKARERYRRNKAVRDMHYLCHVVRTYKISKDKFLELGRSQGWRCAVCRRKTTGNGRRLAVDHDHESGAVLGLLCCSCNRALGLLGDSASRVARLLRYAEQTRPGS